MKIRLVLSAALLLVCCSAFSQTRETAPVGPVVVGPVRPTPPVVHPDGSVTFSFVEANAKDVKLSVDIFKDNFAMTRGDGGVWTFTTPALKPEIYAYHYVVDGEDFADPATPWVTPNLLYHSSMLLVPGTPAQPWEQSNVPHGSIDRHFYHSAVVGDDRDYYVYTPPGYERYDPRGKTRYPVLYLLHGYSDGANGWTAVGQANFIFDNLLAEGKMKPMLVVMTLGYGNPAILHPKGNVFDDPPLIAGNYAKYQQALLTEVMPAIEHDYRVLTGPKNTAIAGLSMGGAETLYTGIEHPDKFGYVAAMSAAPVLFDDPQQGLQWKAKRELLWISCGSEDGLVGPPNQKLYAYLKQQGVDAQLNWTPGMHTWEVWRDNLITIAPLLFR